MKIVFFGTSSFAIPSLRELIGSRHEILAVVTQPDRQKGRNLKISQPPAKVLALAEGIEVYQPDNASASDAAQYLKRLDAELFIVISFGQILKKNVLSIPKLYSLNLHGSLLPKYRGAAPTNWAIINGDKTTGITIIKMNEGMDEGDIILRKETGIDPEDTNITLSEKLSDLGADTLLEVIDMIDSGKKIALTKQDNAEATYAPKLKKEDGLIVWNREAVKIHNMVRGLIPWPGAYTHYDGKVLKVLKTGIPDVASGRDALPGTVIDVVKDKGMIVKTGSGNIAIQYLQLEGKKAMDSDAFVRGHRIGAGYRFARC